MKRPVAGVVLATVLVLLGSGCVAALPDGAATPVETLSMEEPTDVQLTVETTGRHGVAVTGRPPAAVTPVEAEEAPAQPEREPAPSPVVVEEVAPVATGALSIPSVGFSEEVSEHITFKDGGVLRPSTRGLAEAVALPEPYSNGQLLLVHSGGKPSDPGNLLVKKDAGSTLSVGDIVHLPDGGVGEVTRSEVTPKDQIPDWMWSALAAEDHQVVLVTCRPETGKDSSATNLITIVQRTA